MTITTTPIRDLAPRLALAALTAVLALLGIAAAADAATFQVTRQDDPAPGPCLPGDCSLREAVNAANAAPDADTIVVKGGNTYRLSLPAPAEGDLDLTQDVTIVADGPKLARIDGHGALTGDRVFQIHNADVRMERLDVAFGRAPDQLVNGFSESHGGGIRVGTQGTLEFVDGVVQGNRTSTTPPNVVGLGGGIHNRGTLTLRRSRIEGNEATPASFGGGIHTAEGATTTLVQTTVKNNDASFGGGINTPGTTVIESSTISANDAGIGGGIYAGGDSSDITVRNSTISGNTAVDKGGAVRMRSGPTLLLANSTVTDNTAGSDADGETSALSLQRDVNAPATTATLVNTIVAANIDLDPVNAPDCQIEGAAQVLSNGFNLIGNANGCGFAPAAGDQVGSPATPIDPAVGPLARNGGPTQTHALLTGSPAIDTGGAPFLPVDQRGVPRSTPDIGAYELATCQGVVVNRVGRDVADTLLGTPGPDGFLALGGNDVVNGQGGADGICAGTGNDVVLGGAGADQADGAAGRDLIKGAAGNDGLRGGSGRDRLLGATGNDALDGGIGRDICAGGPGADTATACERRNSVP
jgi:CSLREA domain-containing protein